MTAAVRARMRVRAGRAEDEGDARFAAQFSRLGYPGFTHVAAARRRPQAEALLLAVLGQADVDARMMEAMPWLVRQFSEEMNFAWLVRQAKLRNLQNRLGFVLAMSGVGAVSEKAREALAELERSRLLEESTLGWDSMPEATRVWMRGNRTEVAAFWNVVMRMGVADAG